MSGKHESCASIVRCTTISLIPSGNTFTFRCETDSMEGQYVNVVIPGEMKTLTLCEMEVYGIPTGTSISDKGKHFSD